MTRTEMSARARLDAALGVETFNDLFDLLEEFADFEEVGTEDVLAAVLPLMRQTLELHDQGQVAPLDGVEAIGSLRGRLYFGPGKALKPKWSSLAVNRLQGMKGDLDIAGMYAAGAGALDVVEPIGQRDAPPTEPAFLPDYRCWEHAIGNHDPLTDIFSLGMIAASVALGLNFTEERDLKTFVAHRRQLLQLNGRLHPVVAQVVTQMTELDRRRRIQDLRAAIHALETHRQTAASAEFASDAQSETLPREDAILSELRGRLYDLSRRNKLLFHKPSSNELNLTEASTPIVLRVEAIRPEQLFTWGGDLAERVTKGQTINLSEFVRFEEMLYAAPALDKIRTQARKDRTEFGVSQLRLVLAFLRWRNLKEDPEAPITSPLLLLPVELKKRRGVRDSFDLKATTSEAEVNPTLRRYLKLLYGVELPASVDLEQPGAVEALHQSLFEQIQRSEPGVKLTLRATPNVAAMHDRALRKVDLYRRRTKPSSTGLKRVGEISYSYARNNWRPLGLQMHQRYVSPAPAPARRGRAAQMALPLADRRQAAAPAEIEAAERATSGAGAARLWEMDLCSVTLANFNYRKMSLVRDFDALLEGALKDQESGERGGAFAKLFSDAPKPIARPISAPPVGERFEVMPSDPTQAAAVARARTGESYVIQGPPGTGKSQTIANLIADYVGRGKRVLFVCEKRAALDVVHNRLEGLGLHRLCARVHDSQEDKRGFVLDLKALYENWVGAERDDRSETGRDLAIGKAEEGLTTLSELDESMMSTAEGEPMHKLIGRAAEERRLASDLTSGRPAPIDASAHELLPSLADWRTGRDAARAMESALRRMGSEPILARHPARFVSAEASADPALFERLNAALLELGPHLKKMGDAASLAVWDGVAPLAALFAQIDYAARLAPAAASGRLRIMNPVSNEANAFRNDQRWLEEAQEALERAEEKNKLWTEKLSDIETDRALDLAIRHEGKLLSFMSPAWRQVREEVEERCKLNDLAIKPLIKDLLEDLKAEHEARAEVERHLKQLAANLGVRTGAEALQIVAERDRGTPEEGPRAAPLLDLASHEPEEAADRVQALAALKASSVAAQHAIETCFEGLETLPVEHAFAALSELEASRESLPAFAPALRALGDAPDGVRTALRRIDASVDQIEAAIVDRAVERALAVRPTLREITGAAIDETSGGVGDALGDLRKLTAQTLLERARRAFVEHIELTTRLDLELEPDTQVLRRRFVEARRDLDRELSKTQRFRSVRELMAGPAGLLIRDLKPIWLMSPLSVADVLPLDPDLFDVVIFDEASQVPIEEAAPTLFRAPQAIVVGDEKQLPPTNFFGSGPGEDEFDNDSSDGFEEDEGALDLDAESFLAQAAKALPSTLLGWHYRSRSEELIAFSNAVFYAGKLISIPSTLLAKPSPAIIAGVAEDGAENWKETLARPISFHHTPFAAYEKQKNTGEAVYIAEMIRGLLKAKTGKSIGVVAFSEAQQAQIEKALEALARNDARFRDLLDAEYEREEGGQFEGLFVKNLENVQGDERDVIVISVCYGPDSSGRMRMNFGPINRSGGEKRLNVIFSRAKEHVALVSTIKGEAITNDYNTGALCLKTYLKFADAVSRGDQEAMRRSLTAVAPHAARELTHHEAPLAETIAAALRDRGWEAEANIGESAFVCDVAVRTPGADRHQLAVLIDGPAHYACSDILERHVTRPGVLKAFGWKAMTVLSLDWRRNPEEVIGRIENALAAA